MNFKKINKCRICKKNNLDKCLDLGKQPLANSLKKNKSEKEILVPLHLLRCSECYTLQLSHTVNPNKLFSKYVWITGTANETIKYLKKFVLKIQKYIKDKKNDEVLEIASNDGSLLKLLKIKQINASGVEPAKNIAQYANKKKLKTYNMFFNYSNSKKILHKTKKKYSVVICRNVIPHVENILDVFKGIDNILKQDGKLIIEFHYVENLLKKMHFDYIYHEHIFYFSIKTISNLAKKFKLYSNDVFKSPISGGSLVLIFSRNKNKSKKLLLMEKMENKNHINSKNTVLLLNAKIQDYKKMFLKKIKIYNPKIIAGYGASARSNTFINYLKINENDMNVIFDKNLLKKNLFAPKANIKIISPDKKQILKYRVIIILAWNFYDEIKKELIKYKFKGKIIKPLPNFKIEKI